MLRAEVVYGVVEQKNFSIVLDTGPGGLAAMLHLATASNYRFLSDYLPWSESGFAMLAAAFAEFRPELEEKVGPFEKLEIRITATSGARADTSPLCVATLSLDNDTPRLIVTGPVLRTARPVSAISLPEDLHGVIQFVLEQCDPTIGRTPAAALTTTVYHGGTAEAFIFVDELPEAVQAWFVAMTKLTNPGALTRQGQTASARAFEEFCAGRVR
ncbi:hypothetical protein [Burkholderia sp. LMU1-1-1.1]|uniref:hypothetical protein n=1 Tax=Burkholderia sp. LMU1-1-1.1 TaxID=3135266 RepID=UPI00343EE9CB